MTNFQFPVRARSDDSVGDVLVTQTFTVMAADTGQIRTPMALPLPYRIRDISVDTITAFDAATATLNLGIAGTPARFAAALNIKAVGRVSGTADPTKLAGLRDTGIADGSVGVQSALTAAAGTVGMAEVTITYSSPKQRND